MKNKQTSFHFSRILIKNILILLLILFAGFFILSSLLKAYTHHGENIEVPALQGMKLSDLDVILAKNKFEYKVVDSLYDSDKKPGTVLDQDPAPKSMVKEGRTLYLTINAINPPDVKMPDLIDVSYRQAEAMLQSFGLVPGDINYKADLAKNAVLEQRYKNRPIKPGTMIPKGSSIDLVLGDGLGDLELSVPDLIGLTEEEAKSVLVKNSLSLGLVHFDEEANDHASAKIYSQSPLPGDDFKLKPGDNVDVFLK
jgi:beta-lactam-binding protein with PASTA domain